jgi:Helicase associated domain
MEADATLKEPPSGLFEAASTAGEPAEVTSTTRTVAMSTTPAAAAAAAATGMRLQLPPHEQTARALTRAYSRSPNQAWEVRFAELQTWWYASEQGKNAEMVPCDARITRWVRKQRGFRCKGTLSPERLARMNSLGPYFQWTTITTRRCAPARTWHDSYQALVAYFNTHHHVNIPHNDTANLRLYQWSNVQRQARNENNLSNERIALLDQLHFNWSNFNDDRWDACYQQLVDYYHKHGHFRSSQPQQQQQQQQHERKQVTMKGQQLQQQQQQQPLQESKDEDEDKAAAVAAAEEHVVVALSRWANKQRSEANKGMLRADRRAKLEDIGFLCRGFKANNADRAASVSVSASGAVAKLQSHGGKGIAVAVAATIAAKSAGKESVDAGLEQHVSIGGKLRQNRLGSDRQGKRKQPHQEEQQQEEKPATAVAAWRPAVRKPPLPPSSSSFSSRNDRENSKAILSNGASSVTRAMHSDVLASSTTQSRLTGTSVLSVNDELSLQLQFHQLQERRRRQQEQHLLLVRLLVGQQPRLQATAVIGRTIGHGEEDEEQDNNVGEEEGIEHDEETTAWWSSEDDKLLHELHQAQNRVDQLKDKLTKHMSRRHAQQTVARLSDSTTETAATRHHS